MNGDLLEHRIVFLKLDAIWCILFVLGRDVAGHTGHAARFVFRALENDLNAITFFGHGLGY